MIIAHPGGSGGHRIEYLLADLPNRFGGRPAPGVCRTCGPRERKQVFPLGLVEAHSCGQRLRDARRRTGEVGAL